MYNQNLKKCHIINTNNSQNLSLSMRTSALIHTALSNFGYFSIFRIGYVLAYFVV